MLSGAPFSRRFHRNPTKKSTGNERRVNYYRLSQISWIICNNFLNGGYHGIHIHPIPTNDLKIASSTLIGIFLITWIDLWVNPPIGTTLMQLVAIAVSQLIPFISRWHLNTQDMLRTIVECACMRISNALLPTQLKLPHICAIYSNNRPGMQVAFYGIRTILGWNCELFASIWCKCFSSSSE